jgi:transcriptional regulator GlxA family with amidase domain
MLTRLRIDRAKELLRTSTLSVKEIAYQLGYSRQHAFIKNRVQTTRDK